MRFSLKGFPYSYLHSFLAFVCAVLTPSLQTSVSVLAWDAASQVLFRILIWVLSLQPPHLLVFWLVQVLETVLLGTHYQAPSSIFLPINYPSLPTYGTPKVHQVCG